ncbi:hypothetical protein [Elizabethkingia meningoseptica]|nr:hypothetical protein [Elizabethkingia meningoseptica]
MVKFLDLLWLDASTPISMTNTLDITHCLFLITHYLLLIAHFPH